MAVFTNAFLNSKEMGRLVFVLSDKKKKEREKDKRENRGDKKRNLSINREIIER
jgi:hypothetical protein